MCFSAQNKTNTNLKVTTLIMGVVTLLSFSFSPVVAGDVQVCNSSSSCTIGEYLYDDQYQPDLTGICTLNTKNPNGTAHISAQSLTVTADGWYGHTFTAPSTTGYYRGEICCDVGSDHMCLDKSFEVKNEASGSSLTTGDIATAVWGYSNKTLTGFNNIVSDIWGYASRSLTSGSNVTATVSSTDPTIATLKKTVDETRLLLEELVNAPIIENSLEDIEDIDLGERVEKSKVVAQELYVNLLLVGTTVTKVDKNWNSLTDTQITEDLLDAKVLIGDESDSSSENTLFGRINFIRDAWGLKESDDLYTDIKAVKASIDFALTGVTSYGKSASLKKEIISSKAYISSSEKTLVLINKKMAEIESLSFALDENIGMSNKILGAWTFDNYLELKKDIDNLTTKVTAINKVPKGMASLEASYVDITGEKKLKNKVLALRGILFANKKMLTIGNSKLSFVANWLEEGSVVIKTLITNPSSLISQDVPLKYYLPKEVKKENVINMDSGIEVKYDTEKDQYYIEGNFKLKPSETRTIKVRVEDVWIISEGEVDSLLTQTEELVKPLERSSYFAQGITLKSDIVVSLTKVKDLIKTGVTPEAKIKAYREAQVELSLAKENIERLKDMVSQASSSGSILGFVGGSQAIAVWGVVIAIATGFVFMTIYMRKLLGKDSSKNYVLSSKVKTEKSNNTFDKVAVFLVVATISGLVSSITVKKLGLTYEVVANQPREVLGTTTSDLSSLKAVKLVSIDGVVKLYQDEATNTVAEITDSGRMGVLVEKGEKRVKVIIDAKEVWVETSDILEK
jgi:hypothetical protein